MRWSKIAGFGIALVLALAVAVAPAFAKSPMDTAITTHQPLAPEMQATALLTPTLNALAEQFVPLGVATTRADSDNNGSFAQFIDDNARHNSTSSEKGANLPAIYGGNMDLIIGGQVVGDIVAISSSYFDDANESGRNTVTIIGDQSSGHLAAETNNSIVAAIDASGRPGSFADRHFTAL